MLPAMMAAGGAGIGAGVGGALGQLSDTLSYPRRAVWGALGLPEHGTDLLAQYAGMDPQSPLTQALGMGTEIAGDPLTWLLMGAGGVTGGIEGTALATRAGLEAGIAEQAAARAAAEGLVTQHADELAALAADQSSRFADLGKMVDVPGIARGASKSWTMNYDPYAAMMMQDAGIGTLENTGRFGKFTLMGEQLPHTFEIGGHAGIPGNNPWMRAVMQSPTNPNTPFLEPRNMLQGLQDRIFEDVGSPVWKQHMRFPQSVVEQSVYPHPKMFPSTPELAEIMKGIASRGGGAAGFKPPPGFVDEILAEAAANRAGVLAPAFPEVGGVPADLAARQAASQFTDLTGQLSEFDAARHTPPALQAALLGSLVAGGGLLGVNASRPAGQRWF